VKDYHRFLEEEVERIYKIAKKARSKLLDPSKDVEILTANELAGRVESLISVAIPKLSGSGLRERILELEAEFGKGNEEIGFVIADEVSKGRFHDFGSSENSIDAGMRVGTAYWTLGITTAPLEGLTHVSIKKRMDGGNYLAIYFSGPIRSAGGTTTAMIVMLADFLRKKFGIGEYDMKSVTL
jgi:DNA polymerase II large subunit